MSKTLYCTPKCYHHNLREIETHLKDNNIKLCITTDIYINLLHPSWTEARCDSTFYVVDDEVLQRNRIKLEFKD